MATKKVARKKIPRKAALRKIPSKSVYRKKISKFFSKRPKILRKWWQIGSAMALLILLVITVATFLYNAKMATNRIIVKHIDEMSQIFNDINEKCGIMSFEHDANYVDFLTVSSFVGSEIGSMNLRDPKDWQGPYVQDNPTIQTKYYEIIKTKKGYFLVPGNGVKLSSGLVVGEDIIFDEDVDVSALVEDGTLADKSGRPLAFQVPTR